MKKFLFTVALGLAFFASNAQQLPNAGFETWSGGKPTGWNDLAIGSISAGVNNLTQSNQAHSGNSALNIKVSPISSMVKTLLALAGIPDSVLTMSLPGIATNGSIDVIAMLSALPSILSGSFDMEVLLPLMSDAFTNGMVVTQKPASVSGFYKASFAQPQDISMLVAVVYGQVSGDRTVIGFGAAMPTASENIYQPFTADIAYTDDAVPATELIFLAITMTQLPASQIGSNPSNITIDDLSVSYSTDINDITTTSNMVYPNPTHDVIKIAVENPAVPYQITVSDMLGRVVMSEVSKSEINLSSLKNGVYFVKVSQNGKGNVQKIVLE